MSLAATNRITQAFPGHTVAQVRQAVARAAATMPWPNAGLMHEAMSFVLSNRVRHSDDGTVEVHGINEVFRFEPVCPCAEAEAARQGDSSAASPHCVHTWAVDLHQETCVQLTASQPADPPPAPAAPSPATEVPHGELTIALFRAATDLGHEPSIDKVRLTRALELAVSGAVTLMDDGTALVINGSGQKQRRYAMGIDGLCSCEDAKRHDPQGCKHALAVTLSQRALALLLTPSVPAAPAALTPQATIGSPPVSPAQQPQWVINEAPVSSWFKWRVNGAEFLYAFRGTDDRKVQARIGATLPLLEALVQEAEERAGQQRPAAPTPEALQELIRQAVQAEVKRVVDAARAAKAADNGREAGKEPLPKEANKSCAVKPSRSETRAGTPLCPQGHGEMKPSQFGGWYCPRKVGAGYCDEKA